MKTVDIRNSEELDNDKQILSLIKNPKTMNEGMKLLMGTHQETLYQHVRRMVSDHDDTDDILQNVFIKAFRGIEKFEGKSKLSTWLYRIATNEALTIMKKRKKKINNAEINERELDNKIADNNIDGDYIIDLLRRAIDILPEKQKLVFSMRYYDEMSYDQISQVLQVTKGGLKASFHHAVKKIEAYVKENQ